MVYGDQLRWHTYTCILCHKHQYLISPLPLDPLFNELALLFDHPRYGRVQSPQRASWHIPNSIMGMGLHEYSTYFAEIYIFFPPSPFTINNFTSVLIFKYHLFFSWHTSQSNLVYYTTLLYLYNIYIDQDKGKEGNIHIYKKIYLHKNRHRTMVKSTQTKKQLTCLQTVCNLWPEWFYTYLEFYRWKINTQVNPCNTS